MDFEVYGIAAAVVVAAIMEGIKRLFPDLKDRAAWAVTIVVGLVLAVGVELAAQYPVWDRWYKVVLAGIFAALAAGGLYSGAKRRE